MSNETSAATPGRLGGPLKPAVPSPVVEGPGDGGEARAMPPAPKALTPRDGGKDVELPPAPTPLGAGEARPGYRRAVVNGAFRWTRDGEE